MSRGALQHRFSSAKLSNLSALLFAFTSQVVVKPVKETYETVVSIPKETCQKVTQFDEPYKTACFWGVTETSKDGHVYGLFIGFLSVMVVFATSELDNDSDLLTE